MAKENLSTELNIHKIYEYHDFLEKAINRVKSGQSFDAWITSELLMRQKVEVLNDIQKAEQIHVASILETELKSVVKLINER